MIDFLGVGWAFPVDVNARGGIELARRENDIEQAIRIILETPKGQRVMRPEFGCRIHELVFAPNNPATHSRAEYYVSEALKFWEPRIRVEKVSATVDPESDVRLLLEITYEIKASADRRSLVYPFYRIPDEAQYVPETVTDAGAGSIQNMRQ